MEIVFVLIVEIIVVLYYFLEQIINSGEIDLYSLVSSNAQIISIVPLSLIVMFSIRITINNEKNSKNDTVDFSESKEKILSLREKHRSDEEKVNLHAKFVGEENSNKTPAVSKQKTKKGPPGPKNPVKYTGQKKVGFA